MLGLNPNISVIIINKTKIIGITKEKFCEVLDNMIVTVSFKSSIYFPYAFLCVWKSQKNRWINYEN